MGQVLPNAPGIPPEALRWLRQHLARGVGQRFAAAYFAEHPEELAPFLTTEHAQAVEEWDADWDRRWEVAMRRKWTEAYGAALFRKAVERVATRARRIRTVAAPRAPRRQPTGTRTRSSRGQPAGTSSRDDDPPAGLLRLTSSTWRYAQATAEAAARHEATS